MFGLATILQIIFSNPMFSVWTVPERAAPPSMPARTRPSNSEGILSASLHKIDQDKVSCRRSESVDRSRIKEILFNALNQYKIDVPPNYSVNDIDEIGTDTYGFESFVLLKGDQIIGFFILRPINNESIELKRLYLTSSERKKGLGRLLLNKAMDHAMSAGYNLMCLETTSKFKEAVSLYRRSGFREMDDIKKAPGHDLAFKKKL